MTGKSAKSTQGQVKELQEEISTLTLELKEKSKLIDQLKNRDGNGGLSELETEILDEAKKIATNQVSSCFTLVEKTRELISLQKA
jgi:hypothetical protein